MLVILQFFVKTMRQLTPFPYRQLFIPTSFIIEPFIFEQTSFLFNFSEDSNKFKVQILAVNYLIEYID